MHPQAATLWRGPLWTLALLLAALSSLGPFAIDTYLPAFPGMAADLSASAVQMQQTLSTYLFGFALMNLFHGALSDSLGRRPVVLVAMTVFTLASVGCALSPSIGWLLFWRTVQGLSAGGGMVIGRAIIRDLFPLAQAQRVMSQVTIFFGVAPAVAPLVGGWLYVRLAGRIRPAAQIRLGFLIMLGISALNVVLSLVLSPHPGWALWPVAVFSFGWSVMTPSVTLLLLDLVPERRGMASSVQSFVSGILNGLVAGVLAPLVMHSSAGLALASAALMLGGLLCWAWSRTRLKPESL